MNVYHIKQVIKADKYYIIYIYREKFLRNCLTNIQTEINTKIINNNNYYYYYKNIIIILTYFKHINL